MMKSEAMVPSFNTISTFLPRVHIDAKDPAFIRSFYWRS